MVKVVLILYEMWKNLVNVLLNHKNNYMMVKLLVYHLIKKLLLMDVKKKDRLIFELFLKMNRLNCKNLLNLVLNKV